VLFGNAHNIPDQRRIHTFPMRQLSRLGFILISLFFGSCSKDKNTDIETPEDPYQIVWSDEFGYMGLPDNSKWNYDIGGGGWGNNEAQYYTGSRLNNSEVKDGYLFIHAIKEDFEGKKYTSARLVSRQKGDWLYGKFEIRAKLPEGRGMWPAIWMLPTDWFYGGWPDSGEIDIMENLGHIPYFITATVQTKSYNFNQNTHKQTLIPILDCYAEFHTYSLEWEPNEIRIYADSILYNTFRNEGAGFQTWPFDQRFHLILNVAVGGTFGGANGIDDSIFPRSMVIDYVRVYQKK
jgi:beta-glucanase (GH16 family)